jgi:glutathione synthase/RimK-type ligase-like ATP-grasp enzyme
MVFGRMLIHTRGNDICLPGRPNLRGQYSRRWSSSQWWSKYILPTDEWRVHVFDNKSIAVGKKVHSHPEDTWRQAPVRNIGNGWTFDFSAHPPEGLRKYGIRACQALGYPHGGVDILQVETIDPTSGEPPTNVFYVLEVNRIPALTCPHTREAWVRAIRRKFQRG